MKAFNVDFSDAPGGVILTEVTDVTFKEVCIGSRVVGVFFISGNVVIEDLKSSVLVASRSDLDEAGSRLAVDEDGYKVFLDIKQNLGGDVYFLQSEENPVEVYFLKSQNRLAYISFGDGS